MDKTLDKLVPQMKTYDDLGYEWLPFLMFNQSFNFRSKKLILIIGDLDLILNLKIT